jgi:hypothetical protein
MMPVTNPSFERDVRGKGKESGLVMSGTAPDTVATSQLLLIGHCNFLMSVGHYTFLGFSIFSPESMQYRTSAVGYRND